MASVSFGPPDGVERSWELDSERPLSIGRDPSNDIPLRDPRISRHHARITFERGFFVLHDLASANGTFVNGKRIQVAPLVNGAEIRMGSTIGRFSSESSGKPTTVPDRPIPAGSDAPPTDPGDDEAKPAETNPLPLRGGDSESAAADDSSSGDQRYVIELRDPNELSSVRNGQRKPIWFFHRPPRLIAWVGGLMASMVGATGLTAVVVLAVQRRPGPVLLAAALTIAFVAFILYLIPRNDVIFFRDEQMREVDLVLRQEHRLPLPASRYCATDANGGELARFRRDRISSIGRRRWWILNRDELAIGWAEEDSLPRAMARKVAGNAVRALRSNYRFVFEGSLAGSINRRGSEAVVDLHKDQAHRLDRRIAIPLSVLILSVEAK